MKKFIFILILLLSLQAFAQDGAKVNGRADALLEKKARCIEQNQTDFYFYIQIYNGKDLARAKQVLRNYLAAHPNSKAFIKWESPEYKVWTGEYPNIVEVERALKVLTAEYPNAIIVYPRIR